MASSFIVLNQQTQTQMTTNSNTNGNLTPTNLTQNENSISGKEISPRPISSSILQSSLNSNTGSRPSSASSSSSNNSVITSSTSLTVSGTPLATPITHVLSKQASSASLNSNNSGHLNGSIVTIINKTQTYEHNNNNGNAKNLQDGPNILPSLPKYSNKLIDQTNKQLIQITNSDENNTTTTPTNTNNQKIYISTHHFKITNTKSDPAQKISNKDENDYTDTNSLEKNGFNKREISSAKIKIKYNYNGKEPEPRELKQERKNSESSTLSPSPSSSPSSPSSLVSNTPSLSNSPVPNLIQAQANLLTQIEQYSEAAAQVLAQDSLANESNKVQLSITQSSSKYSSFPYAADQETDLNNNNNNNNNKKLSKDSNESEERDSVYSDFRLVKSPRETASSNSSKLASSQIKAKKRVSFNDSLVQVHLIPNVSNILSVEKYKYQVKSSTTTTLTTISSNPAVPLNGATNDSDIESDYQFNILETKTMKSFTSDLIGRPAVSLSSDNVSECNSIASNDSSSILNNHITINTVSTTTSESIPSQVTAVNDQPAQTLNGSVSRGILASSKAAASRSALRSADSRRVNHVHFNNSMGSQQANKLAVYGEAQLKQAQIGNEINGEKLTIVGSSNAIILPRSTFNKREISSGGLTRSNPQGNAANPKSTATPQQETQPTQTVSTNSNSTTTNNNNNIEPSIPHPKQPKYLTSSLRIMSASSSNSTNSSLRNEFRGYKIKSNYKLANSGSESNDLNGTIQISSVGPLPAPLVELTPQLKFLSNLKRLKPNSTTLFNTHLNNINSLNSFNSSEAGSVDKFKSSDFKINIIKDDNLTETSETDDIKSVNTLDYSDTNGYIQNQKQQQMHEHFLLSTSPIIKSTSQSFKNNTTKYIFLKPDDKLNENGLLNSSFSTRSHTIANINLNNGNSAVGATPSNSIAFEKQNTMSDFKSLVNGKSNGDNLASLNKNFTLSSVNQLVALKDVNYYLANSSKSTSSPKKASQIAPQVSYSQNSNYTQANSSNTKIISQNGTVNQVTAIKIRPSSNSTNESDFRRTHSALPLLRNGIKQNSFINGNGAAIQSQNQTNNNNSSVKSASSSSSGNNGSANGASDLKNGINSISYKLINSPMINTISRAKTFIYNQNANTNMIDRRIRGGSIEKTSL